MRVGLTSRMGNTGGHRKRNHGEGAQTGQHDVDAEVGRCVIGPLAGVGHHRPLRLVHDGSDVGACVGDHRDPELLNRLQMLGRRLLQDISSGVHVEGDGAATAFDQASESGNFGRGGVRGADAHRPQPRGPRRQLLHGSSQTVDLHTDDTAWSHTSRGGCDRLCFRGHPGNVEHSHRTRRGRRRSQCLETVLVGPMVEPGDHGHFGSGFLPQNVSQSDISEVVVEQLIVDESHRPATSPAGPRRGGGRRRAPGR
jgi:hypothetical protein